MTELEPLAKALRRELGAPPEAWQQAQRARLREIFGKQRRRPAAFGFAPLFAAMLAVVAVVAAFVWVTSGDAPSEKASHFLAAEELGGPYRFADGSSIVLTKGGRGRLVSSDSFVGFDLQAGRADFDVAPDRERTWRITAGKNEVVVIGTRFSVWYETSGVFEVEVERGVVSVRVPDRSASVELKAGDHLRGRPGHMEVALGSMPPGPPPSSEKAENQEVPVVESSAGAAAPNEPSPEPPPSADWRVRYRDGKYAESLALLRANGMAERLDELGPRTLSEIAEVARLGGDLELAARALSLLMQRFPRALEARDAKFLLGRVHAVRGDSTAAISAFEAYLKPGGSSRYSNEAVGRLIELYSARGDDERARAMARRYLGSAPDGPYRRLARSLVSK